jgi:hypothetical protein
VDKKINAVETSSSDCCSTSFAQPVATAMPLVRAGVALPRAAFCGKSACRICGNATMRLCSNNGVECGPKKALHHLDLSCPLVFFYPPRSSQCIKIKPFL